MPTREWIERDERERIEADIAEGRSIETLVTIMALILLAFVAYASLR